MTKEEIIAILRGMTKHNEDEDAAIFAAIQALSKPELPAVLDEAADAYSENILANGEDMFDAIADGFRAGAGWMALQGVTVDGVFVAGDPGFPDVRMGEQYSIEHILRKPGGIEPGDKVIVQIRKK